MNRAQRRRLKYSITNPSPGGYRSQTHELDEDAVCVHCGFDAAEEHHLRVTIVPPHAREKKPAYAVYCDRLPMVKV